MYLNGWKSFLLRGAAFSRNTACWSPLTLVAEPQPSLLGLLYDFHIYSVWSFVGGSPVCCLFLWLGGLGLSHRDLWGCQKWVLILCWSNKKIKNYYNYRAVIISVSLTCFNFVSTYLHQHSAFFFWAYVPYIT